MSDVVTRLFKTASVAKFEKVSYEEFEKTMKELYPRHNFENDVLKIMHHEIKLPKRSTKHSAGYDFFSPFDFNLEPGCKIFIPTGIRAVFSDMSWLLWMTPKSGLGSKFSVKLSNTNGIIDADYSGSDNEGHIIIVLEIPKNMMKEPGSARYVSSADLDEYFFSQHDTAKFHTDLSVFDKSMTIKAGDKFVQGIFVPYGLAEEETPEDDRNGGFGSTGENENQSNGGEDDNEKSDSGSDDSTITDSNPDSGSDCNDNTETPIDSENSAETTTEDIQKESEE